MASAKTLLEKAQQLNENKAWQAVIDLLPDDVLQQHNSADLFAEKAQAYYRLGDNVQCEATADKALSIDTNNAKANHYKGNIYIDTNNYNEAAKYYHRAITANPNFIYSYNALGVVYYYKQEYEEAIHWLKKAIAINSKLNYSYNWLGNVHFMMGQYNEANAWYQKAIQIDPTDEYPYNGLGNVCGIKGDYKPALGWFQKAIDLNPKSDTSYYNRALAYEAIDKPDKALADYEQYIALAKNKTDYYAKRAAEKVAELRKTTQSIQYGDFAELVTQIKDLLRFSDGHITHYTGLSTTKALVLSDSSLFRLSEGAFLNDTSEGRELFNYLDFDATMHTKRDVEAESFAPKPFIGSFVAETKHDDLTLWRMYGKEDKEEAKGCAITIDPRQLVDAIRHKLLPREQGGGNLQTGNDFSFYRVAYKNQQGQFILPGSDTQAATNLNTLMGDLYKKAEAVKINDKTTPEERQDILKKLNEIAYLFKTAEYQHEQELRLVLDGVGFDKKFWEYANRPRVYIELVNIRPLIQKITIGPKVERGEEWAAAFYYSLLQDGLKPEIFISHLPYK
jgi:tetratricopeptide (TPR) repeat protein